MKHPNSRFAVLFVVAVAGAVLAAHVPAHAITWKGWKQLPHNGTTDAGVTPMSGDDIVVFSKGIDDQLFYLMRRNSLGIGDAEWSPWAQVPKPEHAAHYTIGSVAAVPMRGPAGNQAGGYMVFYTDPKGLIRTADAMEVGGGGTAKSTPSAVIAGGAVNLFIRGGDDKIYTNILPVQWEATPKLGTWSGWTPVPNGDMEGTTDAAPAAAAWYYGVTNPVIFLFAKGVNDGQVYINIRYSSDRWSGWSGMPGGLTTNVAVSAACGLAANNEGELYVVATRNDGKIFVNSISKFVEDDGQSHPKSEWRGWEEVPGITTDASPGVIVYHNKLWIFVKAPGNSISYNEAQ